MASTMDGQKVLDTYFLEMRAKAIEIAASLDRLERAPGGEEVMASDPRVAQLREAFRRIDCTGVTDRAEQLQMLFSLED